MGSTTPAVAVATPLQDSDTKTEQKNDDEDILEHGDMYIHTSFFVFWSGM